MSGHSTQNIASQFSANQRRTGAFIYALHLADNALISGQRNSEWCGHGPVLEQDIAITNISLDLLGQARNFYQYAAGLYNDFDKEEKKAVDHLIPRQWKTYDRELTEDDLAFLREERQYLNLLIAELPKGDWAFTVLRQFLFSAYQQLLYAALQKSSDAQLAAIAEKSIKEVAYHLRWSSEWIIRLGDGTRESGGRLIAALKEIWTYTEEMFVPASFEQAAVEGGLSVDVYRLREEWFLKITDVLTEATIPTEIIQQSKPGTMQQGGKEGRHTEHMGYLLAEMQYMQRTYPNSNW